MKAPTQTEIAAELGISPAALSKLKKTGMPVHSADAARAWRVAHLHPGRVRDDPGPSPRTLVERATALLPLAREALRGGRFHLVAGELKLALRSVPKSHRRAIGLDAALWEALVGAATLAELGKDAARHAASLEVGCASQADGGGAVGPDDDADDDDEPGATLYSLACGELKLSPRA